MRCFKIQGVAGQLCTMTAWQETQTLCSFRLWLSRPRDNPGLDLNMARQDWKEIGGDVATESLQSSSGFLMPAHILVCLIRVSQWEENLLSEAHPGFRAALKEGFSLAGLQVCDPLCIHRLPSSSHKCPGVCSVTAGEQHIHRNHQC